MKTSYNADQRKRMYKALREMIDRAARDDALVASRDVRPDGYTRGGGDGRRNGHGDPTYSVVVQILGGEATGSLVQQYFGGLHMVCKRLEELDSLRASLLPPEEKEEQPDDVCESCFRARTVNHKGVSTPICNPPTGYQPQPGRLLCWFCADWYVKWTKGRFSSEKYKKDELRWPPVNLILLRELPRRITNRVLAEQGIYLAVDQDVKAS